MCVKPDPELESAKNVLLDEEDWYRILVRMDQVLNLLSRQVQMLIDKQSYSDSTNGYRKFPPFAQPGQVYQAKWDAHTGGNYAGR